MSQRFKIVFLTVFLAAYSLVTVAATAPDISLPSSTGNLTLKQYHGQVVYLDFWASWCKPCRKSFPWMNDMQQRYGNKGFKVIAVNVDSDEKEVKRFLEKYKAEFIIAYDPEGKVASTYKVKGMPSSYLIDRQGNITNTHIGFRDKDRSIVESQIRTLLAK